MPSDIKNAKYNVHAYVTGKNGVQSCVGVTTKEVTNEQIVVSAKDTSKKESTYQVKLENQGKYDRIDDVTLQCGALQMIRMI